jgi:hypothetical protein
MASKREIPGLETQALRIIHAMGDGESITPEQVALMSIAVSFKRLVDALDGGAPGESLLSMVDRIADAAERNSPPEECSECGLTRPHSHDVP